MTWLPAILQAVLKYYGQAQLTRLTADKAKDFAIQSSILALGSLIALLFFLAATIMVFVDLGNQFESHGELHFSGMMLSAVFLSVLGLFAFGICFLLAKYFSAKERLKIEEVRTRENESFANQYAPLLAFGEELLKVLTEKISQKN
jgi:uncharacterized membrane protein